MRVPEHSSDHPATDLLFARLREAFPIPPTIASPGLIIRGDVELGDLITQSEWAAVAGSDDYESVAMMVRDADEIFNFGFDGGRPGGSWNSVLATLADGDSREFAFVIPDEMEPRAIARLEATAKSGLFELEEQLFLEVVATEDVMYFPAEVSTYLSNDVLERGLVLLLEWQKDNYNSYLVGDSEGPDHDATDDELKMFVHDFLTGLEAERVAALEAERTRYLELVDWVATGSCQDCGSAITLMRSPRQWVHQLGTPDHEARFGWPGK